EAFRATAESKLRLNEERLKQLEAELSAREREQVTKLHNDEEKAREKARELAYLETKLKHVEQAHQQLNPTIWGGQSDPGDPLPSALEQVETPAAAPSSDDDPFAAAMRTYQKE